MDYKKYPNRILKGIIAAPLIYVLIIPIVFFDIFLELYHQICFRLYEMKLVSRSEYIKIDRHKLKYLNWFEKLNCVYCGYGNGLIQYACEIFARTEKYWCGIKHAKYSNFKEPKHHESFLEYDDEKAYKNKYNKK
jgi:hypothetical protein